MTPMSHAVWFLGDPPGSFPHSLLSTSKPTPEIDTPTPYGFEDGCAPAGCARLQCSGSLGGDLVCLGKPKGHQRRCLVFSNLVSPILVSPILFFLVFTAHKPPATGQGSPSPLATETPRQQKRLVFLLCAQFFGQVVHAWDFELSVLASMRRMLLESSLVTYGAPGMQWPKGFLLVLLVWCFVLAFVCVYRCLVVLCCFPRLCICLVAIPLRMIIFE